MFLKVDEIKSSLEDKANSRREMPKAVRDIDVYTVDEYQVTILCHTTCRHLIGRFKPRRFLPYRVMNVMW